MDAWKFEISCVFLPTLYKCHVLVQVCSILSLLNVSYVCFFLTALAEALRPDELRDMSAVADFSKDSLKHVQTKEKNVIPDKNGQLFFEALLSPN